LEWLYRQRTEAHEQACADVEKLKQNMVEERMKWRQTLAEKELELTRVRGNMEECKHEVTNQVQNYKTALEASQKELEQFKQSFHSLSNRVGHMM